MFTKTDLLSKRHVIFRKKEAAVTCSAVNRAWGDQNTPYTKKKRVKQKNARVRLFSRKQLLGLPIHIKMLMISTKD